MSGKRERCCRRPPMPETMTRQAVPGQCRWCGKETGSKRRTWHPECVDAYLDLTDAQRLRKRVLARDRGICQECGRNVPQTVTAYSETRALLMWLARRHFEDEVTAKRLVVQAWGECYVFARDAVAQKMAALFPKGCTEWQADHRKPLFEANGDLSYWHIDNVRTLCGVCHREKGREEAARRAKARAPKDETMALAL